MTSEMSVPLDEVADDYRDRLGGMNLDRAIGAVLIAFGLPRPVAVHLVTAGYEDRNGVLDFESGSRFLKLFRSDRRAAESERYVSIAMELIRAGVRHPRLLQPVPGYQIREGLPLARCTVDGVWLWACCMEYVPGVTLDLLNRPLSPEQVLDLARQVARIHTLPPTPNPSYDHWSVRNLAEEFRDARGLCGGDKAMVVEAVERYLPRLDSLSSEQVFIHSDLVPTNIILGDDGLLHIVDLGRADVGSPLQEWAVIVSQTLLTDTDDPDALDLTRTAMDEYRNLRPEGIDDLELSLTWYCVCVNAAYSVAAYRVLSEGRHNEENQYWLDRSRRALRRALDHEAG